MQLLREHQLYAKLRKCDFYRDRIQYLGHIISEEGISVEPEKIETIMNWPTSRNVTDVISFIGLAGYYMISLRDYPRLHMPSLLCKRRG